METPAGVTGTGKVISPLALSSFCLCQWQEPVHPVLLSQRRGSLLGLASAPACCSTSAKSGLSTPAAPSGTVAVGSSSVLAKAFCVATLSKLVQRLCQPKAADRLKRGGALRTRNFTSERRNFQLSSLHLPPTSKASTTSLAVPLPSSSGYVRSLRSRARCSCTPSSVAAPG